MPRYSYTVKDVGGKTLQGTDDAPDENTLITRLQNQGYYIVAIEAYSSGITPSAQIKKRADRKAYTHGGICLEDLLIFCHQMATMLDSGVPLLRSLKIIIEQVESKQLADVLTQVALEVEAGNSFSSSIAKHPKVFNQFWVSLCEVGETSGNMPQVLEKLAFYLEQQDAFNRAVVSAVIYPVFLILFAFGAICFFAIVIAPKFQDLYGAFDVDMPGLTLFFLSLFELIRTRFLVILASLGAILYIGHRYTLTFNGRRNIENILFLLPKFGKIYKIFVIERFTSQMAILVESGVPILYALDISQKLVNNLTAEKAIGEIKSSVREGKLIAEPMGQSGFFLPMTVQMIMVGEETGELGKMLNKVSEFYQKTVETFLKRFGTIFEPVMIIVVGVFILIAVVAMYLPIFDIASL